jgi:hypothetical protein
MRAGVVIDEAGTMESEEQVTHDVGTEPPPRL